MNKRSWMLLVLAIAVAGVAGAWLAARGPAAPAHRHVLTRQEQAGKVWWTCTMHPEVRRDGPGACPICGMPLVRRTEAGSAAARGDGDGDGDGIVRIDPRMAQNLGVRTASVTRGRADAGLRASGSVVLDETRIVAVEARAPGWVERLHVRAVGQSVRRGQVLAELYAPEVRAAREELRLAESLGDAALVEAARTRLRLLGGSAGDARSTIRAPQDGVVTELMVREGAQLAPGTPLLRLADLARVWVLVQVPEAQAAGIAPAAPAHARFAALPERRFDGKVDHVYPLLESATRTLALRVVLDNADGALRPGMYAQVGIEAAAVPRASLRVPTEAVIRTGTRDVVIVAEDGGRYRPAAVTLGAEGEDHVEILGGLDEGMRVVVSGQFLIDSEASLAGAYARMGGESRAGHEGHAP